MRFVKLPGTDLEPSLLGFGCAPIVGRVGKRQSLEALHSAFAHGVNYFDVARSYGYGEAERVLGEFIAGKRDQLYVATKFGITVSQRMSRLRFFKPIARKILGVFPGLRGMVQSRVAKHQVYTQPTFSVDLARRSLEESLKQLNTDYVDFYLLHSCEAKDLQNEEIIRFLEDQVTTGKVRHFGVSSDQTEIVKIAEAGMKLGLLQFGSSVLDRNIERVATLSAAAMAIYSPFANGRVFAAVEEVYRKNSQQMTEWLAREGIQLNRTTIATLALQFLFRSLQNRGVVICSMFKKEHIAENIAIVERDNFSDEQCSAFAQLLQTSSR